MIIAFIFFLHFIFSTIVFTKKWQDESLGAAFQNVLLIIIIFSVGWPLITMLVKIFMDQDGFGIYFDRDAFVLLLLTAAEYLFYRFYYNDIFSTEAGRETQ